MTKSKKSEKNLVQQWWFWLCIVAIVSCIAIVAVIIFTQPKNEQSGTKAVKLSSQQGEAVYDMKAAKYLSKVKASTCQEFQGIAKAFDPNARWFNDSFCKYSFSGNFIESDSDYTVYLQDDNYCAEYTFIKNSEGRTDYSVIGYKFSEGKCNSAYKINIKE